jgi:hypothetical protein
VAGFGVTPVGTLGVFLVFFVAAGFGVVVFFFVAGVVVVDVFEPDVLDVFLDPDVFLVPDVFFAGDVVVGVVAAVVVCVDALCAVVSADELSLPQPAATRASTTAVVAVSLRRTARTIASRELAVQRTYTFREA